MYEQNKPTREIAELFGICRSGTRRVKQHLRERGTIEARPRSNAGRKPQLIPELEARIREHVAAHRRPLRCGAGERRATDTDVFLAYVEHALVRSCGRATW